MTLRPFVAPLVFTCFILSFSLPSIANQVQSESIERAKLLIKQGDEQSARLHIQAALTDPNVNVRYEAIKTLQTLTLKFEDVEAFWLIELMSDDAHPSTQTQAIIALSKINDLRVVKALFQALGDSLPAIRVEAVNAILKIIPNLKLSSDDEATLINCLKTTSYINEENPERVRQAVELDRRLDIYPACTLLAVFTQKYTKEICIKKYSPVEIQDCQNKVDGILAR